MSNQIFVPSLGESVTEATVSKWLKQVGEKVDSDEPLVELETDKVNVEVPSPLTGTLESIKVKEGDTVEVGTLLGLVSEGKSTATKTEQKEENAKIYQPPKKVKKETISKKQASLTLINESKDENSNGALILDTLAAEEISEKQRLDPKCWKGYKKQGTKMKGGVRVNNCVKVSESEFTVEGEEYYFHENFGYLGYSVDNNDLFEAEYQGRQVSLNKPMRGDVKKFKVYVKDPKTGNVKKVNFGHGGTSAKRKTMRIRKSNPTRRRSFRARHNCANPGPKTKARYWSCRKW